MIEKIKESCKKKGVPEKYAERIQKTFKIEKEESIDASVDLFKENILPAITEAENEAKSAAESSAVEEYEKKHNLKDGKPVEDENGGKHVEGISPELKAYLDKMQGSFNEAIENLKKGSDDLKETHLKESAKELLKKNGLPEEWISRVDVSSKEKTLEEQVNALGQEYTRIRQDAINEAVAKGDYTPGGSLQLTDRSVEDWSKLMDGNREATKDGKVGVVDLGV